jgi:transcriptional regulator with XRE-family HTH domain
MAEAKLTIAAAVRQPPSPIDINLHVGQRLRQLRVGAGLTQKLLAEILGVTIQQIHKYETGVNRIPVATLWRLACWLEADIGVFFEGAQYGTAQHVRPPEQRRLIDLVRNFRAIEDAEARELLCLAARVLARLTQRRRELFTHAA